MVLPKLIQKAVRPRLTRIPLEARAGRERAPRAGRLNGAAGSRRIRLPHWFVAFLALGGCATPRPDVAADAARLSGGENAIEFREQAGAFDGPPPDDRSMTPARAVRMALG